MNEDIFQPVYIALAMCQMPGSPLPYSWYDGISLIGPCRPLFALHADISRKKCDFLQVLSIGHLAYLFSTSFACVLIEHSFTRISNSYQISLQNIYGYQLCSCILSLQHIRLMQLTLIRRNTWWSKDKNIKIYNRVDRHINFLPCVCFSWFNSSFSIHPRGKQRMWCWNNYLLESTVITFERLGLSQWFNNQTWSAGADIIRSDVRENWSLNVRTLLRNFWNQNFNFEVD